MLKNSLFLLNDPRTKITFTSKIISSAAKLYQVNKCEFGRICSCFVEMLVRLLSQVFQAKVLKLHESSITKGKKILCEAKS